MARTKVEYEELGAEDACNLVRTNQPRSGWQAEAYLRGYMAYHAAQQAKLVAAAPVPVVSTTIVRKSSRPRHSRRMLDCTRRIESLVTAIKGKLQREQNRLSTKLLAAGSSTPWNIRHRDAA